MSSSFLSMLYPKEAIEKAKKRGRAYMCLICQRLTGEKRIGELGPMEDHILKNHVSRDRVPFFCRLCTFKCQTRYQMNHHVEHYSRHVTAAKKMNITNHDEWIVVSTVPYKIGEEDMAKFTQEESLLYFLKKQSGEVMPGEETSASEEAQVIMQNPVVCQDSRVQAIQTTAVASQDSHMQAIRQNHLPSQDSRFVQVTRQPAYYQGSMVSEVQQPQVISQYTGAQNTMVGWKNSSQILSPVVNRRMMMPREWSEDPVPTYQMFMPNQHQRQMVSPQMVQPEPPTSQQWQTQYQVVVEAPVRNPNASPQGATEVLVAAQPETTEVSGRQEEAEIKKSGEGSTADNQTERNLEHREIQVADIGNKVDEAVENILPQLMGSDLDLISEIGSESGTEVNKRKSPSIDEEEEVAGSKKRKVEEQKDAESSQAGGSTVQISLVAINGLVEAIQRQTQCSLRAEKAAERSEKALIEMTCMLGKVVDAFGEFKNLIQERAADEQKREESWLDREKRRTEDCTKEIEAERRREARRRESEKKEREELKKLITDIKVGEKGKKGVRSVVIKSKEETKGTDDKNKEEEKENKKTTIKSVLGKSYTENSIRDHSNK